jgi:ribonucleoside-diphosphate reductase alpha chain
MLDNVIDINYYAVRQARNSNLKHRPVGLGIMGFQDCLHLMHIPLRFGRRGRVRRQVHGSGQLLRDPGFLRPGRRARRYETFQGSLWSKGILPLDSQQILIEQERGQKYIDVDLNESLDWAPVRARRRRKASVTPTCMAIAPTATIANIIGVSQCIEPTYQNLYVKSNLSGEFTVINPYLVRDLKRRGLWDSVMINDLKYYDGSLSADRPHPARTQRAIYATAFEVDAKWLVEAASAAPEVDRPGAVAEHLHGRRVGQEAARHLHAGLAAWTENHLLPTVMTRCSPHRPARPPCRKPARSTSRIAKPANKLSTFRA